MNNRQVSYKTFSLPGGIHVGGMVQLSFSIIKEDDEDDVVVITPDLDISNISDLAADLD